MRIERIAGAFLCLAMLAGCIMVPVSLSDEEPYREEHIAAIVPGETSRQEVVEQLGNPDTTFADGRWLVYRTDRKMGEWLVMAGGGYSAAVDVVGGGSIEYRLVIDLADDAQVRSVNVVDETELCNESRTICLDNYGTLQLAASEETRPSPGPGECAVYFYTSKPASPESAISLEVDDVQRFQIWYDEIYRRIVLDPGAHKIEALGHLPAYFYGQDEFACEGGSATFFVVQHDVDAEARLSERVPERGEQDVAARRSVLHPDAAGDTVIDTGLPTWTFAETVAPHEEVARIRTDSMQAAEWATGFFSLDDIEFDAAKDDLIVQPGCRCLCVGAVFQVVAIGNPVCFDARAEHTYIVSTGMEFRRNVWVNEWPNSAIEDRLEDSWAAAFQSLTGRENRLFKYRYREDGTWYPRGGDPESPYCKTPPIDCNQYLQGLVQPIGEESPTVE